MWVPLHDIISQLKNLKVNYQTVIFERAIPNTRTFLTARSDRETFIHLGTRFAKEHGTGSHYLGARKTLSKRTAILIPFSETELTRDLYQSVYKDYEEFYEYRIMVQGWKMSQQLTKTYMSEAQLNAERYREKCYVLSFMLDPTGTKGKKAHRYVSLPFYLNIFIPESLSIIEDEELL